MTGRNRAGTFVTQHAGPEGFAAFIPAPLPPDPPLAFHVGLQDRLESASRALGRLDGVSLLLPSADLFLYTYVRKEAVLSSQIEGTQSSLSDLLLFENAGPPGVPPDDVREVSNYVAAMEHGLARMREGLPLSLRLLREIHARLLQGTRGATRTPGEFRRSQNWIGGTRPGDAVYVPPPVHEVMPALDNLERFLHDEPVRTPALVKAGLAHAQFETIHPFLDGNGRLGRLLVTLVLCADGVLQQPLLYLSLYLKTHRAAYYDSLQRVRTTGDWEGWMEFFLGGIESVATQAADTTRQMLALFDRDRRRIQESGGRWNVSALRLHDLLVRKAVLSIPRAASELGLTQPTVAGALARLQDLGIVRELTNRPRHRQFAYDEYFALLDEGTSASAPRVR